MAPRDRGSRSDTVNWQNVIASLFLILFGAVYLAMIAVPMLDPQTPYPSAAVILAVGMFILTLMGYDTRLADQIFGTQRSEQSEEDDR